MDPAHRRTSPTTQTRIVLFALGLAVALPGGVFCWLMARSFERAREMRAWPQVEAVILHAAREPRPNIDPNAPPEFRLDLLYGYEWQGQPLTSSRLSLRGSPWTGKTNVMDALLAEYTPGRKVTAWVNPRDPAFAVLKPDSLAPGYSIWFPALFVLGGLGICTRACRRRDSFPQA